MTPAGARPGSPATRRAATVWSADAGPHGETPGRVDAEQRLEALARAHGARVYAYLARRIDAADAADVLQAVLLTAWRRLDQIPDEDRGSLVWLMATARRCAANHRRGRARRFAATERLIASRRSEATDPSDGDDAVARALRRLAPADREVLTLAYWDDLTTDEVAAMLGVTPEAVRKRLQRARSRLHDLIAEREGA